MSHGPMPWEKGKGAGGGREMGLDKKKQWSQPKEKTNLLKKIMNCEIMQYNPVSLESKIINHINERGCLRARALL